MYNLHTNGPGFVVLDPKEPGNALNIADLDQLLQLYRKLNEYISEAKTDGPANTQPAARELTEIDTVTARRLASQQGYKLGNSTLVAACRASNITGAHKIGGRYHMPKWAFLEWFEDWKKRRKVRIDT